MNSIYCGFFCKVLRFCISVTCFSWLLSFSVFYLLGNCNKKKNSIFRIQYQQLNLVLNPNAQDVQLTLQLYAGCHQQCPIMLMCHGLQSLEGFVLLFITNFHFELSISFLFCWKHSCFTSKVPHHNYVVF